MQHAKFILLIKVRFHEGPRCQRFEPIEKGVFDVSFKATPGQKIAEGRVDNLYRVVAAFIRQEVGTRHRSDDSTVICCDDGMSGCS